MLDATRADGPRRSSAGLLFEGAEWDFDTMQRVYDAVQTIALDDLGLDVFPNQIEVISAEQMLDAYSLGRHAADVFALVVRQALRARRGALSQGLSGARLRDRHQLQSLHQLLHGGEHHGDADAGAGARRVRTQPLLQEQLSVPAMDRPERHPRLSRIRQALCRGMRGALRRGGGRVGRSTPRMR